MKTRGGLILLVVICMQQSLIAQLNNLTGSPYSLFGLGVQSNSNIGKFSGLAQTGIALNGAEVFNIYNPASFAHLSQKRFFFDVGVYAELNAISNRNEDEQRIAYNFSNIALGFKLDKKNGLGLSLIPETSVGYALIGLETNIEGSNETFRSNILGSGGLNELRLDYGYLLTPKWSIGLTAAYLFGKIEEEETVITGESFLEVTDENFYKGVQLSFGSQYTLSSNFDIGLTFSLPAILNGSRDRVVIKSLDFVPTFVDDEIDQDLDDFELPFQFGLGLHTQLFKNLDLSADYKRYFWGSTNQEDNIGNYKDQNIVSLGAEYVPKYNGIKYWQRINYRAGLQYDSGYLRVDDVSIDNFNGSVGLGLPVGRTGSMLNISYTRGFRGTTNGILVEENFNLININLSLLDIWFVRNKYE
ncbi:OmpP1/FadL family transporter [Flavobacteriaceae bacterium M23B6Z8]